MTENEWKDAMGRLIKDKPCGSWLRIVHHAFVATLDENPTCCLYSWVPYLTPLLDLNKYGVEVVRMAMNCLGSCWMNAYSAVDAPMSRKSMDDQFEKSAMLLLECCNKVVFESRYDPFSRKKLLISAFRAFHVVFVECKRALTNQMADQLNPFVRYVMDRAHDCHHIASDSDFSDIEAGARAQRMSDDDRARQQLLLLIQSMCRANAKTVISLWSQLFPVSLSRSNGILSLLFIENMKLRNVALTTLGLLMSSCKGFFKAAMDTSKPSNFTSYSENLALVLYDIHKNLMLLIQNPPGTQILLLALQTMRSIVQATPYNRLSSSYATRVFLLAERLLDHEEPEVVDGALLLLCDVLKASLSQDELAELMTLLDEKSQLFTKVKRLFVSNDHTWIIANAASVIGLCVTLQKPFESEMDIFETTMRHVEGKDVESAFLPALGQLALSWMKYSNNQCFSWEKESMDVVVDALLRFPKEDARCAGFDLLSTLDEKQFDLFPEYRRNFLLSLLFAGFDDENYLVIASVCRCVGLWISFSRLLNDEAFVIDILMSLTLCLGHSNLQVRIRASWALANFTDHLSSVAEAEQLTQRLLCILRDSLTRCREDNDKLKPNLIRCMGNILQFIPLAAFLRERNALVAKCIEELLVNVSSGMMKTRWNACHTLGNLIQTQRLVLGPETTCTYKFFETLSQSIYSKNYKVRIHSAHALSCIKFRRSFVTSDRRHDWFYELTRSVLQWFCSSIEQEACDDPKMDAELQAQYRKQVEEEMARLVNTLLRLAEEADLNMLKPALKNVHSKLLAHLDTEEQVKLPKFTSQ